MKITKEFLDKHNACKDSLKWVIKNNLIELEHEEFINELMKVNRFNDANWLMVRLLKYKKDKVRYAVNAAKLVLHIFEDKYPDDNRPRKAIEAAENYVNNNTAYEIDAADAAAAYAAAYAANAADAADAYAAAAYAAAAGANAAAADAAAYAANAADAATKTKIINYGLNLIKGDK